MSELSVDTGVVIVSGIGNLIDSFNVVFRIVFFYSVGTKNVYSFVVGNSSFDFTAVASDQNVSIEVNLYRVDGLPAADLPEYAVIGIDNFDVGIAEVMRVIVCKDIIPPADSVTVDSVAGKNA